MYECTVFITVINDLLSCGTSSQFGLPTFKNRLKTLIFDKAPLVFTVTKRSIDALSFSYLLHYVFIRQLCI